MSSNKKRDVVESDDDKEYDNNYEEEGTSDEDLLRKIGILCKRCKGYNIVIKRLKMELRLLKFHVRPTKCQIRIDYVWDGNETYFVLSFNFY
jgi:hypothetical protein